MATSVSFSLLKDQPDVEFRFTVLNARALERSRRNLGGMSELLLQPGVADSICALTCYALRWQQPNLTEEKTAELVQAYYNAGGDRDELRDALLKALKVSGVYGKWDDDDGATNADPQTPAQTPAA